MIYSLNGKLIYSDNVCAVVECAGVGYKCQSTLKTLAQLPQNGNDVFLYTYMSVREDSVDLYGFYDAAELNFFKLLVSVNGIGPKIGLAILSDFTPDQVALCIANSDAKTIAKANGVGIKKAQRIVLELKDKVSANNIDVKNDNGIVGNVSAGNAGEAVEALISLGFTASEASKCVARIDPQLSVEEIIKQALKAISK